MTPEYIDKIELTGSSLLQLTTLSNFTGGIIAICCFQHKRKLEAMLTSRLVTSAGGLPASNSLIYIKIGCKQFCEKHQTTVFSHSLA